MRLRTLLTAGLLLALVSCNPVVDTQAERTITSVILISTEGLEPPAVPSLTNAYKPTNQLAINADNHDAGDAAGIFLELAATSSSAVRIRLVPEDGSAPAELGRVAAPATADERELGGQPRAFNDTIRSLLAESSGVFWLDPANLGRGRYRFAILIPMTRLATPATLEVFTSLAADGTAVGAARLELVSDFFYMAVLGDSVQWGNGLEERQKMSSLVAEDIEQATGRRVVTQRYAQSGATIVPRIGDGLCTAGCYGEAPTTSMSITTQVGVVQEPERIELVLVDGCINDVGLSAIINPNAAVDVMTAATTVFCDGAMSVLLQAIQARMPRAAIVVTGYFQIVSLQSDVASLRAYAQARSVPVVEDSEQLLQLLTERSVAFRDTAHTGLRAAVARVNAAAGGTPRVAFADPAFGEDNAMSAPHKWLWSLTSEGGTLSKLNLGLDLFPEDPVLMDRLDLCLSGDVVTGPLMCIYTSVGHPNPTGEAMYAAAVTASLRELGTIP